MSRNKMSPNEKAARFELFARMRLEGRSDVTYRAYDLLTTERMSVRLETMLATAGQHMPSSNTKEPMSTLRARFMSWGFPVMSFNEIEDLLHEYWVYNRILRQGKKNWPYRDPDEARKLYDQNEAVLKQQKLFATEAEGGHPEL
jgi:hypothetical protein